MNQYSKSNSPSPSRHERKKKRHRTNSPPPAPSDYAQLCQHFQFVVPETSDSEKQYGSTWQQRMVKHYHSHLYKEFVLADLSRVLIGKNGRGGPVGLRWRTAREVTDGKGFRSCGNLACEAKPVATTDEEYTRRVRTALGVGVAENGGKIPSGVLLPNKDGEIERYLQSCEREHKSKFREHKKKHRKLSKRRSDEDDDYVSNKQEAKEQKRLSNLSHGLGLHDYEVDFAYTEQNQKKRELVKIRLCLRCAPLIFDGWAIKARLAREKAARMASENDEGVNDQNESKVQPVDTGNQNGDEKPGNESLEKIRSNSLSSSSLSSGD